ncbi:MAG: ABC transporter permease, partial [Candidatus Thorarchaeota archaeon]
AVILATLLIPSIPIPFRLGGIEGLLLITLILFIASYLGSRVVQLSVSSLYSKMEQKMGERVLYVIQSLRRRHGKFIPLMIILSLSFTTSIMMLIQSSSFEATMHADVTYSYGADIRLECYIPYQLEFAEELEDYEGIDSAMPVMSRIVSVESDRVFLKGIVPSKYSKIGTFGASTFPHSTPSDALNALESNFNGVIVSEEYSKYLNKTIGDTIRVRVANYLPYDLLIVDTMRSAPGFGYAHPLESKEDSIALNLGYQVSQDGFMLVNIEFLTHIFGESAASLFFISADLDTGFSDLCDTLLASYDVRVDTPHWDLIPERERLIYVDEQVFFSRQNPIYFEVKRFVSGLQGITLIGSLVCILMAIASIGLFFGAAIEERKPEYAIMRAVGATHYQIYTMVFSEFAGLVISAMILSFGMGAIFGYASTSLVLSISPFSPILPEIVSIPALLTFIVIAGEFTVLLAACYYPAKKAGSVSMAMELRNL